MRSLAVLLVLGLFGCTSAQKNIQLELDPQVVFDGVCGAKAPGKNILSVSGKVWMKATSKEASGQFPASVEVRDSKNLFMEVTNLLGATQATIRIEGKKFVVEAPEDSNGKKFRQEGMDTWGGIPLVWAAPLFLGRIPCPDFETLGDAKVSILEGKELLVRTPSSLEKEEQSFRYGFRDLNGHPWVDSLVWDRKGSVPFQVSFRFEEPEEKTRSPKKWEAKSTLGEVKVRWKGRETESK